MSYAGAYLIMPSLEGITSETTKFDVVLSDVRNRNALEIIPALRRTELPKASELTKATKASELTKAS